MPSLYGTCLGRSRFWTYLRSPWADVGAWERFRSRRRRSGEKGASFPPLTARQPGQPRPSTDGVFGFRGKVAVEIGNLVALSPRPTGFSRFRGKVAAAIGNLVTLGPRPTGFPDFVERLPLQLAT